MLTDDIGNMFPQSTHSHAALSSPLISNNKTLMQYGLPSRDSIALTIGLVSFYSAVFVTAFTSNTFILIAVFRRLVPRNTVNTFLASLAVSDFMMVLLSLFDCVAYLQRSWLSGEWTCKIQSYLLEVTFSASTLTLVAVSVERFFLICFPHMKKRSIKTIYCYVVTVWLFAGCICGALIDGYIVYRDIDHKEKSIELVCGNKGWSNRTQLMYYSIYSAFTYLLPLFLMAYAHWRISVSVKESPQYRKANSSPSANVCYTIKEESSNESSCESHDLKSNTNGTNGAQKSLLGSMNTLKRRAIAEKAMNRREKRIKAIRILFVVTVVFFILWTPFILLRIIALSGVHINSYIYKFSEVLIFSSTAVNGFIYAFMSPPFKKAFRAIICCQGRREFYSRDSGPSFSNSEDRLGVRPSKGSVSTASFASETKTSTLNSSRTHSNGSKTAIV